MLTVFNFFALLDVSDSASTASVFAPVCLLSPSYCEGFRYEQYVMVEVFCIVVVLTGPL